MSLIKNTRNNRNVSLFTEDPSQNKTRDSKESAYGIIAEVSSLMIQLIKMFMLLGKTIALGAIKLALFLLQKICRYMGRTYLAFNRWRKWFIRENAKTKSGKQSILLIRCLLVGIMFVSGATGAYALELKKNLNEAQVIVDNAEELARMLNEKFAISDEDIEILGLTGEVQIEEVKEEVKEEQTEYLEPSKVELQEFTGKTLFSSQFSTQTNQFTKTVFDDKGEYVDGITKEVMAMFGIEKNDKSIHEILDENLKKNALSEAATKVYDLGLGQTKYFNPYDITQLSGLTSEDYNKILRNLKPNQYGEPLLKNGDIGYLFVEIEKQYGINGIFALALCQKESGSGSSLLAHEKLNFVGLGANDIDPSGMAKKFETRSESLHKSFQYIKDNYLSESGPYYNGKSIFDLNVKYCSQIDWATHISQIGYRYVVDMGLVN